MYGTFVVGQRVGINLVEIMGFLNPGYFAGKQGTIVYLGKYGATVKLDSGFERAFHYIQIRKI